MKKSNELKSINNNPRAKFWAKIAIKRLKYQNYAATSSLENR